HAHKTPARPAPVLAVAGLAEPAAAQSASACANEAQRLSNGFSLSGPISGAGALGNSSAARAVPPSARIDSNLTAERQRQAQNLSRQARSAGERGDPTTCLQNLNQARTLLRQSGFGTRPPSSGSAVPSATDAART